MGEEWVTTALLSPRLQELMSTPHKLVVRKDLTTSAYTDRRNIYISADKNPSEFCQAYAHELQHCRQRDQPDVKKTPRALFVSMMIEDEVEAKVTESDVLDELNAAEVCLHARQLKLINVPRHQRYSVFSEWVKDALTSTTSQTYAEYYGLFWDRWNK